MNYKKKTFINYQKTNKQKKMKVDTKPINHFIENWILSKKNCKKERGAVSLFGFSIVFLLVVAYLRKIFVLISPLFHGGMHLADDDFQYKEIYKRLLQRNFDKIFIYTICLVGFLTLFLPLLQHHCNWFFFTWMTAIISLVFVFILRGLLSLEKEGYPAQIGYQLGVFNDKVDKKVDELKKKVSKQIDDMIPTQVTEMYDSFAEEMKTIFNDSLTKISNLFGGKEAQ